MKNEKAIVEPDVQPDFIESVRKAQKGKFRKVCNVSEIFQ